jgi:dTDP-4-amino-4,6-dideoxygalactose transaminase
MTSASLPALLGGTPTRRDPYPAFNTLGPEEKRLANEVIDSGVLSDYVAHHGPYFAGGRMVKALEAEFCSAFGVRHAVSVNSATSGLHAAVLAGLVGYGDEVIIPPYTMSATATMVAAANATPVFADVDAETFCIDVADVERKISPRTKAIIAVNLFGRPAALHALRALADARGLVLIEDNAQAPGGKENGRFTGTIGHMGVFSLNFHKTIQCGEGGVVVTNDDVLADRLRLVRNHGEVVLSQRETVPSEIEGMLGYNYRLTELQAAIALAQVRRLDELTTPRIAMAELLSERLGRVPGLSVPRIGAGDKHVYYMYSMRIDPAKLGLSRAQLKRALDAEGVTSAVGYVRPIYLYPMYADGVRERKTGFGAGIWHPQPGSGVSYARGTCPVTERLHFHELVLTGVCRHDLPLSAASEFADAVVKVLEHREAVRRKCLADGVE